MGTHTHTCRPASFQTSFPRGSGGLALFGVFIHEECHQHFQKHRDLLEGCQNTPPRHTSLYEVCQGMASFVALFAVSLVA
jgi:hypothetical protein